MPASAPVRKPQPPSPRRGTTGLSASKAATIGGNSSSNNNNNSGVSLPPAGGFSLMGRPSTSSAALSTQKQQPHQNMMLASSTATESTSSLASNKNTLAQWKSSVLRYEVAMRELTANSNRVGPSMERVEKVLELFDGFISVSPHVETILKLFRLEFCRAIFPGAMSQFASGSADGPVMGVTAYFEQVETVAKDKAILEAELDAVENDSSIETLKKQLNNKQSLVSFYEHEVTRLTKENKRANEEINRMAQDIEATTKQHHSAFAALDEECHRLTKENRELQLTVFKLGKDNREQAAGQGIYTRLKQSKYDTYQDMFADGNEEASLMMVMHQLEALENEALEEYESELFKSTTAEMSFCRTKFTKAVELLLEEYHASDFRRKQLKTISRSGNNNNSNLAASIGGGNISDQLKLRIGAATGMNNEELEADHAARVGLEEADRAQRLLEGQQQQNGSGKPQSSYTVSAQKSGGGGPAVPVTMGMSISGMVQLQDAPEGVAGASEEVQSYLEKRKFWAGKHFGNMFDRGLNHVHHLATAWEAQRTLHQPIVAPLLDVSSTKFLTGLELHVTTPTESSQFLKTVNYVDPAGAIELPPKTSAVKVKYTNPLMKSNTLTKMFEDDDDEDMKKEGGSGGGRGVGASLDPNQQDKPAELPDPMEWVGNGGIEQEGKVEFTAIVTNETGGSNTNGGGGAAKQNRNGGSEEAEDKDAKRLAAAVGGGGSPQQLGGHPFQGPHWTIYRRTYSTYTPYLARTMDVHHVDQLMFQVFSQHQTKLIKRFEACEDVAASRSTGTAMARTLAERLFREDYSTWDLQNTVLEVLEARYVFPEVAMKVYYELLTSIDKLTGSNPYCKAYSECLAHQTIPSIGFLLSLNMHLLATYWPLSTSQGNEPISERDLASVLKGMYPSESLLKINTEELVNDILISTNKDITLNKVRDHFAASILNQKEPILLKLHQMHLYRAGAVHWSELDFNEFWETIKGVLAASSSSGSGSEESFHTLAFIKQVYACCVSRKPTRLSPTMLAYIAAELLWTGASKHRSQAL